MKYMTAYHTDVGTRKKTNQDSMLVMEATHSRYGDILMAVVCDGMGGLAKGELASAEVVLAMQKWFHRDFPGLLEGEFDPNALCAQWKDLVVKQDYHISDYGEKLGKQLGTTITALLLIGQNYYIMNVGDSRIYMLSDQIYQMTKDHTLVQSEVDAGHITPQQAAVDPRRSVLTQCVGATEGVYPDFFGGQFTAKQVFMLCCDGFRHVIQPGEFYNELNYRQLKNEKVMHDKLVKLTELIKVRGETDNISAILIRCG